MSRASTSDLVTIRSFDVVLILFTITRNSKTESQYDLLTLARNAHSVAAGLGFGDVGPPDPIQSCVRRVLQSLSETSYIWKGEKNPLSAQFSVLVIKPSPPPRRPHHQAVPITKPTYCTEYQANLLYQANLSSHPTKPPPTKPWVGQNHQNDSRSGESPRPSSDHLGTSHSGRHEKFIDCRPDCPHDPDDASCLNQSNHPFSIKAHDVKQWLLTS